MLGHRVLNVEDYLTILKRRWWIILLPTIVFPIVAFIITFFIPAKYQSQTLVLINQQKVPDDIVKPVISDDLGSRIASIEEQILSRSKIEPIINKYNLYADRHLNMDERVDLTRKDISIVPITSAIARSNGLPGFKIFFTAGDPNTAQQVCAEITSLFTATNLASRTADAQGTTSFLKEQLEDARRTLDEEAAKLSAFQRQYSGMLPEDETNNINILNTLNSRLDAATQAVQGLEASQSFTQAILSQQVQASSVPGNPTVQSPGAQQKELEDLKTKEAQLIEQYTPEYPEVKAVRRRIAELERQMEKAASAPAPVAAVSAAPRVESAGVQELKARLNAINQQLALKRKEQDQLSAQIRAYQGKIQATPQVEEQAKQLTRDHDTAVKFYNDLLAQTQRAKMGTDLENRQQGETFSLLDSSNLPDSPIWPKRNVFTLAGFAFGLTLGLMIVGLLEYKDTALRTERDVWAFTQLPTLAVIAWSGDVAHTNNGILARLKRPFSRKAPKQLLPDAPG